MKNKMTQTHNQINSIRRKHVARSRALTVCLPFGGRRCSFILHGPTGWQLDLGHGGGIHARDTGRQRPPDGRTDGRRQEHGSASLSWSPDGGRGSSPHAHVPHGRKRDEEGQRCGASPDREEMNKFPESPSHLCISSLRTTSRDREQLQGSLGRHVFRFPSL